MRQVRDQLMKLRYVRQAIADEPEEAIKVPESIALSGDELRSLICSTIKNTKASILARVEEYRLHPPEKR